MTWNAKEIGPYSRTLKHRAAEILYRMLNRSYGLEITPEDAANLMESDRRLQHNPGVIYSNHVLKADLQLMTPVMLSMQNAKRIAGPAGMKHWDLHRDPVNGSILRSLRLVGIRSIPVIQTDDTFPYDDKLKTHLLIDFTRRTSSLLNQPGTLYGIAPEGTRNPAGVIQRVSPGLGMLESYMKAPEMQISYQPVGFVYRDLDPQFPHMVIAPPFTLTELLPETNFTQLQQLHRRQRPQVIADLLMSTLAIQLPDHMQGAYAEPDTMLAPIGMTRSLLESAIANLPSLQANTGVH